MCIPYKDTKGRGRFNWGEDFFHYTERNCLVNFTRYHSNSLTDCPLTNFTMYTIVIFFVGNLRIFLKNSCINGNVGSL